MTMLIKARGIDDHIVCEAFTGLPPATVNVFPPTLIERLDAEVVDLKSVISEAQKALPMKLAAARKEGRAEASAERDKAEQERLKALQGAFSNAELQLARTLASIEAYAPLIARAVLERVFSDPEARFELLASSLNLQLGKLANGAALQIRVSPADFKPEALAGLIEPHHSVAIVSDDHLKSGECIIDLKLGHVDVGLGTQWDKISVLLADSGASF